MLGRREFLRALGAGAATAALAPLGCGPGGRRGLVIAEANPDQLRQALRDAVITLGGRLDQPRAWLLTRRRVRVLVDVAVAEVVEERSTVGVLSARDGDGRRIERCFDEVTAPRVAALAAAMAATGGRRREVGSAIPPPVDHGGPVEVDPARLAHADWLARARDIARRSERAASSRIVYRAAWLASDDDRVWAVGEDGDRHQRLVRSRFGATFVAWHGSTPQFGEAEIAGGFGPAVVRLDDEAIARAAAEALALFTPSAPPIGRHVVLLDPGVVAALVAAHVSAPRLAAPSRPGVTIVDDPTAGGYAGYWFDDDGAPARATPLFGGGAGVGATLGVGHARRQAPTWRLAPVPAQLVVAAGAATAAELEAGINDGLVIEGVRDVHIDDAGVVVVRVTRGRQLAAGVRTGRQWGDLEVRGGAADLFSDAIGVSQERREVAVASAGSPQSVSAPWLLTRARVGQARGAS